MRVHSVPPNSESPVFWRFGISEVQYTASNFVKSINTKPEELRYADKRILKYFKKVVFKVKWAIMKEQKL